MICVNEKNVIKSDNHNEQKRKVKWGEKKNERSGQKTQTGNLFTICSILESPSQKKPISSSASSTAPASPSASSAPSVSSVSTGSPA